MRSSEGLAAFSTKKFGAFLGNLADLLGDPHHQGGAGAWLHARQIAPFEGGAGGSQRAIKAGFPGQRAIGHMHSVAGIFHRDPTAAITLDPLSSDEVADQPVADEAAHAERAFSICPATQ